MKKLFDCRLSKGCAKVGFRSEKSFGNIEGDDFAVDIDDEFFVQGKQNFATVLRFDGQDDVAAVIAEIHDFADDAPRTAVADLEADERVFLLFLFCGDADLAADKFFGLGERIDILELYDQAIALFLQGFKIKRNRQSIESSPAAPQDFSTFIPKTTLPDSQREPQLQQRRQQPLRQRPWRQLQQQRRAQPSSWQSLQRAPR